MLTLRQISSGSPNRALVVADHPRLEPGEGLVRRDAGRDRVGECGSDGRLARASSGCTRPAAATTATER